jgi:hypothetical protein
VLTLKAGTRVGDATFAADTPVTTQDDLEAGADYGVRIADGVPVAVKLDAVPGADFLGGFHFAPGGNAEARSGGNTEPAINPRSFWDQLYRPACVDPRGMTLVIAPGVAAFWCDIYLLAADHIGFGTSRFGVEIADGSTRPQNPKGKRYAKLDYAAAAEIVAQHGKQLLSYDEFRAAAFGVTEKSAIGSDPDVTGLDAPRTSRFGLMQATGNLWQWGHDGDPDTPRASIFGGRWWDDGYAGSRRAGVAYDWPGGSSGSIGARGRCDHLQPA